MHRILLTQLNPITPSPLERRSPTMLANEHPVGKYAWKRGDCQFVICYKKIIYTCNLVLSFIS